MLNVLTEATQEELFSLPAPAKRSAKHPARDLRSLIERRPVSTETLARLDRNDWELHPELYARRCWAQVKRMAEGQP